METQVISSESAALWSTDDEVRFIERWREWDVPAGNLARLRLGLRSTSARGALVKYATLVLDGHRRFDADVDVAAVREAALLAMADALEPVPVDPAEFDS